MATVKNREVSIPLGIVVEKRPSTHPWADWKWVPVSVFLNAQTGVDWEVMLSEEGIVRYHAATLLLTLHRKETEALCANLMLDQPELYIVLQESDGASAVFPYTPHIVTASSYEAQDFHDAGDDIIEKVPMPDAVAALIQAFVGEHHVEEKFIKRRRDKMEMEDQKFGKQPIFADPVKQ